MKHYKFVLVENSEEEEGVESNEEEEDTVVLAAKVMQLSLKSKEGLTSNRSFKVIGKIGGYEVLVLVDCGASSNFISKKLVKNLNLGISETSEFVVEVGNGEKVRNTSMCQKLEVEIQGIPIVQHFFLMELGGTDLVLGMDWLASLGDVQTNFKNLVLSWGKRGDMKMLRGEPSLCKTQAYWKAMLKALRNEGEGYVLSYQAEGRQAEKNSELIEPTLEAVLLEFDDLFREPTDLPPRRGCDHAITLKEGSKVPNIRPYRYPYYQKN